MYDNNMYETISFPTKGALSYVHHILLHIDFIYGALRWGQNYYELDIIIVKNLLF